MSDDWQVGDLALCVKRGHWYDAVGNTHNPVMRAGMVLTVRRVGKAIGCPGLALWFEGVDDHVAPAGFGAIRFRKIRPLSDEEHRACIVELAADQRMPADAQIKRPGHPIPVHVAAHASASISQGR